ncbi:MAG: L-arabinose ABC transporter permease AraH [Armatimonadetes bacterium]|nr:L-arabinose ABC transporter permease AraH [Armatimonadota bacterium]
MGKNLRILWDRAGIGLVLVGLLIYAATVPNFATATNLVYSLGLSLTTTGIVACGMLFCLASGDFDLSVGSVAAFAGTLTAVLLAKGLGAVPSLFIALLASMAIGAVNGAIIAVVGINALITTLATMQIVRGTAYLLNDGNSLGIGDETVAKIGTGNLAGIPMPIWILVLCLVVFGLLLHRTVFGRHTLAIGGNKEATFYAGVPLSRVKITIFALQALLAGLAGVVSSAQQQLGDPKSMMGLELRVISACVLGGVSLTGGLGSIFHVVVGVLIMGTVQNVMDLKSVPTFYQYLISGAILLAAVMLDRLKTRSKPGKA